MGRLDGHVALVTGAGRGIGKATARRLAREGAQVVVNDLDEEPAQATVDAIEDEGGTAVAVPGDVSERDDCEAMVEEALEAFDDLHVLVNNAGLTRDRTVHKMTDEEWDLVQDVVLRGAWHMVQAAADVLRQETEPEEPNRKVVNVTSRAGLDGNAGQANYASAKAGLVGLTRTLAREWATDHVNVNAVAPGMIDTRLTQAYDEEMGLGIPEGKRDMMVQFMGWGPGDPEDVAGAIAYLASPDADYVTGEVLRVEGPAMGSGL